MGVRGLTTFLQQNNLLSQRCLTWSEERKVIIVDGNGFVYWMYMKYDLISAPDYSRADDILFEIFDIFQRINVQLVFVFDGPLEIKKLRCKLERLSGQAQAIVNPLDQSSNAFPLPLLAFDSVFQFLNRHCTSVLADDMEVNRRFSHLFVHCLGEADCVIVYMAMRMREKCYGILSNDSDMIIYNNSPSNGVSIPLLPLWSMQWSEEQPERLFFSVAERETVAAAFSLPSEVSIPWNIFTSVNLLKGIVDLGGSSGS
jgi:hypothetical protein